jgi:hypothetical protein
MAAAAVCVLLGGFGAARAQWLVALGDAGREGG